MPSILVYEFSDNNRSARPPKNISYEDLLISKYMEDIQLDPKRSNKPKQNSPYLQKLSHSNLLQVASISSQAYLNSNRSTSRANSSLGQNGRSMTLDAHPLNVTSSKQDSPNNGQVASSLNLLLRRPLSTPVNQQQQRIGSGKLGGSGRKKFFEQPNLFKAVTYPNGKRSPSTYITAKTIADFLDIATERLQLPRAARRLFLENGDEIRDESHFIKNAVVYVSCGEDFADPYAQTKELIDKRKGVLWKSDGIHLLNEETANKTAVSSSNRLSKKNRFTRRVMAFENGSEYNPTLVVFECTNPLLRHSLLEEEAERLEKIYLAEFLEECSSRLKLNSLAKAAFNWEGRPVSSVEDVPRLDKSLQQFTGGGGGEIEYSPVWVSKGEGFVARNALIYVEGFIRAAETHRRELVNRRDKIERNMHAVQKENFKSTPIRLEEMQDSVDGLSEELRALTKAVGKLGRVRANLQALSEQQASEGYTSLFKHIKEMSTDERLFGGMSSKGVRLKVMVNGKGDTAFEVFFNTKNWFSADEQVQRNNFEQLLEEMNRVYSRVSPNSRGKFTRLFSDSGEQIKVVTKLTSNDEVWVSQGESWCGARGIPTVLSLKVSNLVVVHDARSEPEQTPWIEKIKENMSDVNDYIEEEFEDDDDNDDNDDDDDDDDNDKNVSAAEFFKNGSKQNRNKSNKGKTQQPINSPKKSLQQAQIDFGFRTFLEPLNIEQLKKFEKSEHWDALSENNAYEKINSIARERHNAACSSSSSVELDFNKGTRIVLECNGEASLALYPQLLTAERADRGGGIGGGNKSNNNSKQQAIDSIWLHDHQMWKFSRNGFIYNSFFPKLCLTLNTSVAVKLEIRLKPAPATQTRNGSSPLQRRASDSTYQDKTDVIIRTGYAVILGTRQLNESNADYRDRDQQWHFNVHGHIYCKALSDQGMVLTSKDLLIKDLDTLTRNGTLEGYDLQALADEAGSSGAASFRRASTDDMCVLVLETFKGKQVASLAGSQRWAIKQENSRSIGEWRLSELSTSLWHKMALTWPINQHEELIDQFKWPMCGLLMAGAPPLRSPNSNEIGAVAVSELAAVQQQRHRLAADTPARTRLRVLRNGERDAKKALTLSQMDAKNLMKDFIHCTRISYRSFEFTSFLSTCTQALGLPSAARRLFDEEGVEHAELSKLSQDQLVYVSMGEAWVHPKLAKQEQDKKAVLTNLAEDLVRIGYFSKLKDCRNFVLEVANWQLREGSRLLLNQCCLRSAQIERIRRGESIQHVIELEDDVDEEVEEAEPLSSHEKSHINMAAIEAKKFRWPWEQINLSKSVECAAHGNHSSPERSRTTLHRHKSAEDSAPVETGAAAASASLKDSFDPELAERLRPLRGATKKSAKNARLSSQKFAYNRAHGYIYCAEHPSLVLGVLEGDNGLNEVFLQKKSEDNINQRWLLKPNGVFLLKGRANMALTVKLPPIESAKIDLLAHDEEEEQEQEQAEKRRLQSIYANAAIVLQPLVDFENGNAHQKFYVDEKIGFIYAFATSDIYNIEIMAANKANICSHYVTYDKELSQPGYLCEFEQTVSGGNSAQKVENKVLVCSSCAKATRGRFRMTKLIKNQTFDCFIGKSKEKYFKQFNSFKYLTDKVDLSTAESPNSFAKWHLKYLKWRKETSAKTVLNELSASKTVNIIKIYAYKNGEGRQRQGELLVGSSIQGILDQATTRLQLRNAARRLYTEDGTLILDFHDLITWSIEFYRKKLYQTRPSTVEEANGVHLKADPDGNFLDKVDLADTISSQKSEHAKATKTTSLHLNLKLDASDSTKEKALVAPTKKEIRRLLDEYDRTYRLDAKKLFRWPAEIWVSCGEPFVDPRYVQVVGMQRASQREQTDRAEHELAKQKHALRHMTGRRMGSRNPGELKSIKNPRVPVVKEGHWSQVPYEEHVKAHEVHQLKSYVEHIKSPPSKRASAASNKSNFGGHQVTKRVLAYNNGEVSDKAVYCWAANIDELNDAAKVKLSLNKPVKFLFTQDGRIISRFDEITRDQLVCVSTGREFIRPEVKTKEIELRANWGRVKKEEGIKAMNSTITSKKNPIVDVDPFGPPLLTSATPKRTQPTLTATMSQTPHLALPAPDKRKLQSAALDSSSPSAKKSEDATNERAVESGERRRPKSRVRTRSPRKAKSKSKSKSPKRVSVSTELPSRDEETADGDKKDDMIKETFVTSMSNSKLNNSSTNFEDDAVEISEEKFEDDDDYNLP